MENNLSVINTPGATTFEIVRGNTTASSCIDVTLISGDEEIIKNWRVSREYNASDHNTINFGLMQDRNEVTYKRNFKDADVKPLVLIHINIGESNYI